MEKIIIDKSLQFALRFTWNEGDTHWLNFQCVGAIAQGRYPDFKMEFAGYDTGNGETTLDFDLAFKEDPLCEGFIKWDGCMEIHNLSYHFCGYSSVLQDLVKTIYTEAKVILGEHMDSDLANLNNI